MSDIKSITVVNSQGTSYHEVGRIENCMKINKILDTSIETPEGKCFIYEGITEDKAPIFTLVNLPVEIKYFKEE